MATYHHLETECDDLVRIALHESPHVLAARWRVIEEELRHHMAAEQDASDHARLRELADQITEHLRHGGIHSERLRRLAALLRAHLERDASRA